MLLLLALVPAFLGEAHFNAQSYTLDFGRTPERRELDYVRQTAASVETAKEVKIFGLNGFLIDRYRRLADGFYAANRAARAAARRLGRRCSPRSAPIGYYLAYAYIVWRTLTGEFSIGDLTFLAGSFLPPAHPSRRAADELLERRRPGALPQRSVLLLRDASRRSCRRPTRGRSRSRSARASSSRMSASSIPAPSAGRCAISASRSRPARWWRWSARTAPARPRW